MDDLLATIFVCLWVSFGVVCFVGAMQSGELARDAQARIEIIDAVFRPWLATITPGSPRFSERMDDYHAAWERWRSIPDPPIPIPARWMDSAFNWIEARAARRRTLLAKSAVESLSPPTGTGTNESND